MKPSRRARNGHSGQRFVLLAVTIGVVAALVSGSAVFAQSAPRALSGVVAVSGSGQVRALGVRTFPQRAGSAPIVDIQLTPTGHGYLTLGKSGATHAYGDAVRLGSVQPPTKRIAAVALELVADGRSGYVVFADGSVRAIGRAALRPPAERADRTPVVDA
ncbi:MAG: hypothetical protein NZL88_05480, partial [Gaiellaceae bacterium]|nr:hypothetical protein [Gaiellaceae bacterium]